MPRLTLILVLSTFLSTHGIAQHDDKIICAPPLSEVSSYSPSANEDYIDFVRTSRIGYIRGSETFKIFFKVNNPDIKSIRIQDNQNRLTRNGRGGWQTLYDDGSHGDERRFDGIFTTDSLTISGPAHVWSLRESGAQFTFRNDSTENFTAKYGLTCVRVDTSEYPIPEVYYLDDDVQYTDYIVNIVSPLEEFRDAYHDLRQDDREVAKVFYQYFEDNVDWLACWQPYPTGPFTIGRANGTHYSINNEVENIGRFVLDNSEFFGSTGALRGFISINNHQSSYDGLKRLLNHEILHQWCCLLSRNGTNDPFWFHQRNGGHWNPVILPSSGFGGGGGNWATTILSGPNDQGRYGWDFTTLGRNYNTLEMYFMGLLPQDSVDVFPTQSLINPSFGGGSFGADTIVNVTKDMFFDSTAARIPIGENLGNQFKMAGLVVYDRLLEPVEMAAFHYYMKEYEEDTQWSFYQATGGRASIETRLTRKISTPVADVITSDLNLYPNPASDILFVRGITGKNKTVEVYDAYGRLVKSQALSPSIDISNLGDGVYFIKVGNAQGSFIVSK